MGWTSNATDGLNSNAQQGDSSSWDGTATKNIKFKNLAPRANAGEEMKSVKLTATWRFSEYAITYELDQYVTISNPTKAGCEFMGWTSNATDGLNSNARQGAESSWDGTSTKETSFKNLAPRANAGEEMKSVKLTAKWKPSVIFDPQYSGIENWNYTYKDRFTTTYDETTKLNTISVAGQGGWEYLYIPINTVVGRTYTMQFDFQTDGYTPLSGYSGLAYQFRPNTPEDKGDGLGSETTTSYLPATQSQTETFTISKTATTETSYFVFNFGTTADGATANVKLGNFKLIEAVNGGEAISTLPVPAAMRGYEFEGWYTAPTGGDKIETTSIIGSSSVTYYAHWALSNVTVTFDANSGKITADGNEVNSIDREYLSNATYGELPTTTREGYTFKGWSSEQKDYAIPSEYQEVEYIRFTGGQYIDTGIIPTNHTTEVKFDFETYDNDEHLFGTESGYNYYHFTAYDNGYWWGRNNGQSNYFSWTTGTHTLVYNGNNYSVTLDGREIDSGNEIASTNNLLIGERELTGVRLRGIIYYFKITDKTTGNVVRNFIPCYRKSDNEIGLYDTVNGTFYTNNGTGTFEKGEDKNTFITSSTKLISVEDHTVYAVWEKNQYRIEYDLSGGTAGTNAPTTATYDTNVQIDNPTKAGYQFAGWTATGLGNEAKYNNNSWNGETQTGTENNTFTNLTSVNHGTVTLIAHWIPNSYTITYELNGGTAGAAAPTTAPYDQYVTISNPTKTGYEFLGWTSNATDGLNSNANRWIKFKCNTRRYLLGWNSNKKHKV